MQKCRRKKPHVTSIMLKLCSVQHTNTAAQSVNNTSLHDSVRHRFRDYMHVLGGDGVGDVVGMMFLELLCEITSLCRHLNNVQHQAAAK